MLTELKEFSKLSQQIENISEETVKRNHTNLELKSNWSEKKSLEASSSIYEQATESQWTWS